MIVEEVEAKNERERQALADKLELEWLSYDARNALPKRGRTIQRRSHVPLLRRPITVLTDEDRRRAAAAEAI
jgi:hypothetical protein